jgi:putative acetyltransferase
VIRIRVDDLTGVEIAELLQTHLNAMREHSPEGSVSALDLDGLRAPEITFWSAWDGETLAGCGAVKQLGPTHGEIKSMRTAAAHLRKGVAAALLQHIIDVSRERGYRKLSLETGSTEPFMAAHRLYSNFGFVPCGPFSTYSDEVFSRYFELVL